MRPKALQACEQQFASENNRGRNYKTDELLKIKLCEKKKINCCKWLVCMGQKSSRNNPICTVASFFLEQFSHSLSFASVGPSSSCSQSNAILAILISSLIHSISSDLIGSINTPVTRTHLYLYLAQKCSHCRNGSFNWLLYVWLTFFIFLLEHWLLYLKIATDFNNLGSVVNCNL